MPKLVSAGSREYWPGGKKNRTPGYTSWYAMIRRCYEPGFREYGRYGGRGIRVCERWLRSFESFLLDMGPRPSRSHTIDRVDNNGHYEPDNCRWATRLEQNRNSSHCHFIEFNGRAMAMTEFAESCGLSREGVRQRLKYGWTVQEIHQGHRQARTCPACDTEFIPSVNKQRCCSQKCAVSRHRVENLEEIRARDRLRNQGRITDEYGKRHRQTRPRLSGL